MYYVNGDPLSPNKNNNQKAIEEQALCRGSNCYAKISLISLKVSAICTVQQHPNAVFFNHFAAAEPSVNVCVAHGTLCNDLSVYIATTAQNCGCEFRPGNFCLFRRNPRQPLAEPRLKNTALML